MRNTDIKKIFSLFFISFILNIYFLFTNIKMINVFNNFFKKLEKKLTTFKSIKTTTNCQTIKKKEKK